MLGRQAPFTYTNKTGKLVMGRLGLNLIFFAISKDNSHHY